MRIFRVAQEEEGEDLLGDSVREVLRAWEPDIRWTWGELSRSNDGLYRLVTDREHLDEFRKALSSKCSVLGKPMPEVHDLGGQLVIEPNGGFYALRLAMERKRTRNPDSYWYNGPRELWRWYKAGDKVMLRPGAEYGAGPNDDWRRTLKELSGKAGVLPSSGRMDRHGKPGTRS